jgi:hypothetical protein
METGVAACAGSKFSLMKNKALSKETITNREFVGDFVRDIIFSLLYRYRE